MSDRDLGARLPPPGLPGLDPSWSRLVETKDGDGDAHTWHVLDSAAGGQPGGERGTLLCVHGNPTWSYLWRRLVAAPPAGWRVVAPDQLGMGFSDRPAAPRTLAQRVADLGDLTDALGLSGPVVTVGHDWGGIVSLGWAVGHRRELAGVVLANTAVAQPPGDRGPALIRLAHAPGLRPVGCVATPVFVRATTALSVPPLPAAVRDAFAAPYRSAARRRAVGDFVADIPFAEGHPSRPELERIAGAVRELEVPALFLWGPRDPVFGERYLADLRERLPQAQLHRYEGASHLLPEDAPQYAAAVADWVGDELGGQADGAPAPAPAPPGAAPRRLWTALEERAADETPAVVEVGGTTLSWRELAGRVRDLAAGLAAAGVRPGDRVGLLVPPSAELTTAVYALWRAGAVVVVADKGLGLRGMRRALRGASLDWVVGGPQGLAAARAMGLPARRLAAGAPAAAALRALGAEASLAALAERGRGAPTPPECPVEQDCAVLFTSGATGPAKGVVYRHAQAAAQVDLVRTAYGLTAGDRFVAAFAPFALLGPALGVGSAVPDVDVTEPGSLSAAALADAVAAVGGTVVFASPAALRRVVATAGALTAGGRAALGGVRLLVSAGAPVPAALLREVAALLPAAEPHTPYGMTEALPVTDVSLAEIEAAVAAPGAGGGTCVGRPLPGIAVRVSPLGDDGAADGPLTDAPDVVGEVCVSAAHVKDRYDALWATERAASRDRGWHRTGDVGHLDAEGRLWIEGRLAHVLTVPGGVLTPVGPEQRVLAVPGVRGAAVVGVGPAGTQAVVVVVETPGPRGARLRPAPLELADAVRAAAGVPVAAVLRTGRLPVDVRHQSKVDRAEVARRAARLLAGPGGRR